MIYQWFLHIKLIKDSILSLTWVYGSGNTITLPKQQYLLVSQYGCTAIL